MLKAASSCLRYLMAVQNHLLSNTILIKPDENDDSDSSLQGETLKVQVNTKFYSSMALYSQCSSDSSCFYSAFSLSCFESSFPLSIVILLWTFLFPVLQLKCLNFRPVMLVRANTSLNMPREDKNVF